MSETDGDIVERVTVGGGPTPSETAGNAALPGGDGSLDGNRTTGSIPIPAENTWSEDTNVVSQDDRDAGDVQESTISHNV